MPLSFVEKIALQTHDRIDLITANRADGTPVYAYIRMNREQLEQFHKDVERKPSVKLEEYGTVLRSGSGNPSEADREYMEAEYGFNHTEFDEKQSLTS